MKAALTVVLSLAVALFLVGGLLADKADKAPAEKEVKVMGSITCAKCDLKKADNCATVVVAKEGGKDVVYYFDAKGDKDHHKEICKTAKQGTVTGTVAEKDGKKTITVTKVEFK